MATRLSAWPVSAICFLLALLLGDACGGEFCTKYNKVLYCRYRCCGSFGQHYCCGHSVGLIVGAVIGGIVSVSVIIIVICIVVKKKGYSGRVIGPVRTGGPAPAPGNVTVFHTSSHTNQHAMSQPPPIVYSQSGVPPPPGYPPPPPSAYVNPNYPTPTGPMPLQPAGFAAPAYPAYAPTHP